MMAITTKSSTNVKPVSDAGLRLEEVDLAKEVDLVEEVDLAGVDLIVRAIRGTLTFRSLGRYGNKLLEPSFTAYKLLTST